MSKVRFISLSIWKACEDEIRDSVFHFLLYFSVEVLMSTYDKRKRRQREGISGCKACPWKGGDSLPTCAPFFSLFLLFLLPSSHFFPLLYPAISPPFPFSFLPSLHPHPHPFLLPSFFVVLIEDTEAALWCWLSLHSQHECLSHAGTKIERAPLSESNWGTQRG